MTKQVNQRENCPFCGWPYSECHESPLKRNAPASHFVQCASIHCRARGPLAPSKPDADKRWNLRSPPQKL